MNIVKTRTEIQLTYCIGSHSGLRSWGVLRTVPLKTLKTQDLTTEWISALSFNSKFSVMSRFAWLGSRVQSLCSYCQKWEVWKDWRMKKIWDWIWQSHKDHLYCQMMAHRKKGTWQAKSTVFYKCLLRRPGEVLGMENVKIGLDK